MTENWHVGWALILLGMLSGAGLGLGFASDSFLGGYQSFRRRLLRLGHIACIALGAGNVLIYVATREIADPSDLWLQIGCWAAIGGAITMPTFCFLSAWQKPWRHGFAIPVSLLLTAVVLIWWRAS